MLHFQINLYRVKMFPLHWGGVYRTDKETIKVAVDAKGEQILITCFKGFNENPWFIWLALKIEFYSPNVILRIFKNKFQ